jgi:hypothetical protein
MTLTLHGVQSDVLREGGFEVEVLAGLGESVAGGGFAELRSYIMCESVSELSCYLALER